MTTTEKRPENAMRLLLLVGLTRRTGTNLLRDLLTLHPSITPSRDFAEDCLLGPSDHLRTYEERITQTWGVWTDEERIPEYRAHLYEGLGRGIEEVILSQPQDEGAKWLATKSPVSRNLTLLPKLMPGRPLVVVIRDGRATVESTIRSFDTPFRDAVEQWRRGTEALQQLRADHEEGKDFTVVRFEDLWNRREEVLTQLLERLGLEFDSGTREGALNLPVRGSCEEVESEGQVEWKEVVKGPDFDPTKRHEGWTKRQKKLFAKLAGPEQEALGYEC